MGRHCTIMFIPTNSINETVYCASLSPVSSLRSRKNFWLKMKATPLISSTLASAVVFLLMKFAVMAIASLPLNSFLLKPARQKYTTERNIRDVDLHKQTTSPFGLSGKTKGNVAFNHNYKAVILA